MNPKIRRIAAFLLIALLIFCTASAESSNTYTLTKETDRVKTKHNNGYVKVENLDEKDCHFGWGLGEFYIQGYSDVTTEADGTPVFLLEDGDQITLGFRLKQDLDALNGDPKLIVAEDKKGHDTAFEVKGIRFGRGCLILQKTNPDGSVNEPAVIPDYLTKTAENSEEAIVGPLEDGSYSGQLDYELKYSGIVGIPGYNDYKIPIKFKIRKNEEQYHEIVAAATTGITPTGVQTSVIVIAVSAVLICALVAISLFVRKKHPQDPMDPDGTDYGFGPTGDPDETGEEDFSPVRRRRSSQTSVMPAEAGTAGSGQKIYKTTLFQKIRTIAIFVLILVLCIFGLRPILKNPATYPESVSFLEERLANTNKLVLGSGSASFIISLFPDDTGTPIANELAKISSYLLVVMSAILLEKYLITAIGLVASIVIFPAACLFGIISALSQTEYKKKLVEYSLRLFVFGICIILIIPLGCVCGRTIEDMNRDSINRAMANAEEANAIVEQIPEGEEKNIFQKVGEFFSNIWSSATQAYDWGKTVLSNYMSSVAIMIVTSVAIPIILFIAFIWIVRFLTKRDFTRMLLGFTNLFTNNRK